MFVRPISMRRGATPVLNLMSRPAVEAFFLPSDVDATNQAPRFRRSTNSLLRRRNQMLSLNRWHRTSVRVLLLCLAVLSCVSAVMSQAQSNAADLQGTVRDQNGAVVANASVTARNAATNTSREATTNDDGYYKIINLPPGDYELTVKASSYKTAVIPSVKVTIGQTVTQDVPLEVGDLTATV